MKALDYRKLKNPSLILSDEFKHLFLLLYWPLFGLAFLCFERLLPDRSYYSVVCGLDSYIPFCEFFIVPYYFWFAFIVWIMIYSLLFDVEAFKKFSWFVIITYTLTSIIYAFYPTMQELRPTEFARDNICIDIVKVLYEFDTNTNVCPSLHVIGSMAVMFTAWHSNRYSSVTWRIFFTVITAFICASTVFLKQHSIIDVFAGFAVSFAAYPFVFSKKRRTHIETEGAAVPAVSVHEKNSHNI